MRGTHPEGSGRPWVWDTLGLSLPSGVGLGSPAGVAQLPCPFWLSNPEPQLGPRCQSPHWSAFPGRARVAPAGSSPSPPCCLPEPKPLLATALSFPDIPQPGVWPAPCAPPSCGRSAAWPFTAPLVPPVLCLPLRLRRTGAQRSQAERDLKPEVGRGWGNHPRSSAACACRRSPSRLLSPV